MSELFESAQEKKSRKSAYNKEYRKRNREHLISYVTQWRISNPNYDKERYLRIREESLKRNKEWRTKNREKSLAYWRSHNLKRKEQRKEYVKNNRVRALILAKKRWEKAKLEKSNLFWSAKLRTKFRNTILGKVKSESAIKLLGCSVELFRLYLQNQFRDGMAWNNYGTFWELDHIKPCASFDLSNPEEQAKCFHYSNMQPLSKEENRKKGAKLDYGK